MNIILFEAELFNKGAALQRSEGEGAAPPEDGAELCLPAGDERAKHIRKILKLEPGDVFRAGVLDGPTGEMRVLAYGRCRVDDVDGGSGENGPDETVPGGAAGADRSAGAARRGVRGVRLRWKKTGPPVGLYALTLIVGYTRPISAKRILREAASLGVERIIFTGTETGEKSYREANLWKEESRWRRFIIDGLQQAGGTVQPRVSHARSVPDALDAVSSPQHPEIRLLLDNETGRRRLAELDLTEGPDAGEGPDAAAPRVILAVGSERGWTEAERDLFEEAGFSPVLLGSRILRTETACAAGAAITLSRMGVM